MTGALGKYMEMIKFGNLEQKMSSREISDLTINLINELEKELV